MLKRMRALAFFHYHPDRAWKLRASRFRPRWRRSALLGTYVGGFYRRRRTVHLVGARRLRWLASRRTFFRQARDLGFLSVGRGVYFNPEADCSYMAALDAALEVL